MTNQQTKHPNSISAVLEAARSNPDAFQCAATAAPWETPPPAADAPAASELLTVDAASKVVPLSVKQLYRVAERSDGPFRKVEGRLMAYADDLHRWIKDHPTGSKPETETAASDGDSLADRVRRRRERGESS